VALGFGKVKKTDAQHVGTIVEEALRYVTRRVSQKVRDKYNGHTESTKVGGTHKLTITLTHDCGYKIVERLTIPKGDFVERSATAAAHKGVAIAKALIAKIENHNRQGCAVRAVKQVAGAFGQEQAARDYETGRIDPRIDREVKAAAKEAERVRKMKCDICGETDDETYPPWEPCEHVRKNETASRKKSVANKRVTKRTRRSAQEIRQAAVRAAERQSAMDRHVRTGAGEGG